MPFFLMTLLISVFGFAAQSASDSYQLTKETRSALKKSLAAGRGADALNNTTWKLTSRFCAASLAESDISSPTLVYDIAIYHQTWHFDQGGRQVFEIHNASKDTNKCATKISGQFGFTEIPEATGPINAVLATTTVKRERVDCPTTYTGPSLGLIHLLTLVSPTEFRDATLAGSINNTVCPSTTDYLITAWKKYETL